MKTHLLLVFTALALAAAKDYRPLYEQASPDRNPSPNIIGRSVSHKPQDGDYGDGDGESGPGFEDGENHVDVDTGDPKPDPTQTQDPSHDDPPEPEDHECTVDTSTPNTADSEAEECPGTEPTPAQDPSSEDTTIVPPTSSADEQVKDPPESEDTTIVPPSSTADAQVKDPPEPGDTTIVPPSSTADAHVKGRPKSEPTREQGSYDGSPWPADEEATALPPTSTADAEAVDPPESKSTQKSSSNKDPSETKDEQTTTVTSTSTVTRFVTAPFPSSGPSSATAESSPTPSGVINDEEPVELAEIAPNTRDSGPISIVPLDSGSADSSIPQPTSPSSESCGSLCDVGYPVGAGGSMLGSEIPPIESRPPSWPTRVSSGLTTAGSELATADSWNQTAASASASAPRPADYDEELSDGSAGSEDTPEATDAADAVKPPATGDYPEGPTSAGSHPPGWSPTTGAVATQTELAEGISGARRWVSDVIFAGGVFMLMALAVEL